MSHEASKLFVGGLPEHATHADLVKLFGTCGSVFGVKIVMDRKTNRSKGFAFVEMATPADARAAIQKLDGFKLADRRIFITAARPQEKRVEVPVAKPAKKAAAKTVRPAPGEPGFVERRSGLDRRRQRDAPVSAGKPAANPGGYGPGFGPHQWKKAGRKRR